MKIIKAHSCGFCFGVKKAYDKIIKIVEKENNLPVYTIGELVHNQTVVDELHSFGVKVIKTPEAQIPGIAIIRAHGLAKIEREDFLRNGYVLIDATCPVILDNQERIEQSDNEIIIIGEENHSEVITYKKSLNHPAFIVSEIKDIIKLDRNKKYDAVVQTTFNEKKLSEIKEVLNTYSVHYLNDICSESKKRRLELEHFKDKADFVIIVGDKKSENTLSLLSKARELNIPVSLVERESDINKDMVKYLTIGVISGASTPDSLIEKVIKRIGEVANGKI